ncbi:MAG: hypothetical protein ACI9R3_005088 [Verrucomicrobiales bacterium]|jgi:hypothetical protein
MPAARIILFLITAVVACLVSTSCSTFHRDWRSTPAGTGIKGKWDGTWQSNTNSHAGKLRCIVAPSERSPGQYEFRYWGTFAGVFRFHYTVDYVARKTADTWNMDGESDLGIMGGKFLHSATVRGDTFDATYSSKWDKGTFHMVRPEPILAAPSL